MLHECRLFLLRQEIAFTLLFHLVFQLGIKLTVVHRRLEVDVALDGDANEPSATRRVCQRHRLVGGANERGVAAMTGIGCAVGRTVLQVARRHEVLQHDLLPLGDLVELIEVDQRKRGQPEVQVVLVLEIDAVVVVFALVSRQQDPTETRLAATLPAY